MEKDKLTLLWQSIAPNQKSQKDLSKLLKESSHPVLKSMKKQILIELFGFIAFLFCYYSMFDGINKPILINIIMSIAILCPILHNFKGYYLQKQFKSSNNLKDNLSSFIAKLKSYSVGAIIVRIIFVFGILLFFGYGIKASESKWWVIVLIIIVLSIQLLFLYKIWSSRINRLKLVLLEFKSNGGLQTDH